MSSPQVQLPANVRHPKRYVTSHDADSGKSIYVEFPELFYYAVPGFANVARSYATRSLPVRLADEEDVKAYKSEKSVSSYRDPSPVVRKPTNEDFESSGQTTGANVVILDLIPGAVGHWHRTLSLDFSVCISGEIDHELNNGEKVRLFPGYGKPQLVDQSNQTQKMLTSSTFSRDHIIQRATMHRWSNASKDQPARLMGILLPSAEFRVAGKSIEEQHLAFGQALP